MLRFRIGVDEVGRGVCAGDVVITACWVGHAGVEAELQKLRVRDSKKIGERERERLYDQLVELSRHFPLDDLLRNRWLSVLIERGLPASVLYCFGRPAVCPLVYQYCGPSAFRFKTVFVGLKQIKKLNILGATLYGMTEAVQQLEEELANEFAGSGMPLAFDVRIDGNQIPGGLLDRSHWAPHTTRTLKAIVGGDASELAISAASDLAKVARDRYMREQDQKFPQYGFAKHKGYCTPAHKAALEKHGPCAIHRETFEPVASLLVKLKGNEHKRKNVDDGDGQE